MPSWLTVVLQVAFFVFIFLVVYHQLKNRVLYKLHPNKWIILFLAIAAFFLPTMIATYFNYSLVGTVWQYVQSAVFIVLFLWFVDIRSGAVYRVPGAANKKKNDMVIRPKAKPNRMNKSNKK